MKKILLFCLLIMGVMRGYGQGWGISSNIITFDPGDSSIPYLNYVNWQNVIRIDTINYHNNIWQVGRPQKTVFNTAYSFPNAIVTDTLHPYPPNDTSAFILTFPGGISTYWINDVSFFYQLDIDSNATTKIEFSPDSGRSWINLADSTPIGFMGYIIMSNTPGWQNVYISINAFIFPNPYLNNDSLQLKFTFSSGHDTSGKDGWMIDNIMANYSTESSPNIPNNKSLTLYPNPANTELTIRAEGEDINDVRVTNVLGQRVLWTAGNGQPEVTVNVSGLAAGMYFVRVNNPSTSLKTWLGKFVKTD